MQIVLCQLNTLLKLIYQLDEYYYLIKNEDETIINIEVQIKNKNNIEKRALYYGCKLVSSQLKKEEVEYLTRKEAEKRWAKLREKWERDYNLEMSYSFKKVEKKRKEKEYRFC